MISLQSEIGPHVVLHGHPPGAARGMSEITPPADSTRSRFAMMTLLAARAVDITVDVAACARIAAVARSQALGSPRRSDRDRADEPSGYGRRQSAPAGRPRRADRVDDLGEHLKLITT